MEDLEDLANLLSDSDCDVEESNELSDKDIANLNFVDYDDEDKETNSSENNYDPFSIDNLSSEESSEDEPMDNQIDTDTINNEQSDIMEQDNESNIEQEETDLHELHPWPKPKDDSFPTRVINIENIPVSMNENVILQTIFHEIPSEKHPTDIRLYHHRHYFSDKINNKLGYGHIIFDNADVVEEIMPLLKEKQLNPRNKYRLFRKSMLKDIVTDHTLHHNLKDNTLRLVFINLSWKCKALNIYQFIKNCLILYKKNNNDLNINMNKMLPIKIQIIEDNKGYSTSVAFVDFNDNITASTVLFACHRSLLMNRIIYVDWHPYPKRVKTWIEQQILFQKNRNTQTLLIYNLHHKIIKNDVQSLIEKHLIKIKNNKHNVIVTDIQLIHNRNRSFLCGYCLVSFMNKNENNNTNVFDIINELKNRIQHKILNHRSILVMFTQNLNDKQKDNKNIELKNKTRFLMFNNLVWDINKVNLGNFINKCNAKTDKLDIETELYHSINIIVDSNGYPIGKALIKCVSPEIATQIITELDGKLCRDRNVYISWCNHKKYEAIQSKHNNSFWNKNIIDFSSYFNLTQMTYLNDQLFGDYDFSNNCELKERKRKKKERKNSNIFYKYTKNVWDKRRNRKKIFQYAKITMVDERMLKDMKRGKTLQETRPKTIGEMNAIERKGKIGTWSKLGMSKGEMFHLKKKIDWNTGKSVLSKVIASKRTIHVKDYWKDSIKHSRRRNRNRLYIQKTNKHNQWKKHGKFRKRRK